MDKLKDYSMAVKFFNKVAYESTNCGDQWKSPYLHLRRMQCYSELIGIAPDAYLNAQDAISSFNSVVPLLDPSTKNNAMCQYRYLKGQLMYKEYNNLCDKKKKGSSPTLVKKINKEMKTLRSDAIKYIEDYENQIGDCSSMSNELDNLKDGC